MQKIKHLWVKVGKERGTLNISLGFAHKGFNCNFALDKANMSTPIPDLMDLHDKDVLELYIGVSGVAGAGAKLAKFYASQDGNVYYGNKYQTLVADLLLKNLIGALCSCFEGITIAVTLLGTINGIKTLETTLIWCQKPQNHRDFHLSQLLGGREGFPNGSNKANNPNEDGPNDLFERYELRDKSCDYYCCYCCVGV